MSIAEMNVYPIESEWDFDNEDFKYGVRSFKDFAFKKSKSKNMDLLWEHFHTNYNYPRFYLGIAKKVAVCKCPNTGIEERHNSDRCLTVANPTIGSINHRLPIERKAEA